MDYSLYMDRNLTFQLEITGMDFYTLDDRGMATLNSDYDSDLEFDFKEKCGLLKTVKQGDDSYRVLNENFNKVILSVDMKNQFARLPIYDILIPKVIIETLKELPDCSDLKIDNCKIIPGSFLSIFGHVNKLISENEETRNNSGEMSLQDIDLFVKNKYVLSFYLSELTHKEFSSDTTINEKLSSLSLQRNDYVVFNTLP